MNCPECNSVMVLDESYNRGRRRWEVYLCLNCGTKEIVKVGKLPYNKRGRF